MKIVFISRCNWPSTNKKEKIKDPAADQVSKMMIEGFSLQKNIETSVVNIKCMNPWPNQGMSIYESKKSGFESGVKIKNVPFVNIPLLNRISVFSSLLNTLKVELNNNKSDWIICYALTLPTLAAICLAKKLFGVRLCVIVPDLPMPEYMNPSGGTVYVQLKRLDVKIQKLFYKYIDRWVYFSKQMNEFFNCDENKFIVMEGMVRKSSKHDELKKNTTNSPKIICYTGGVSYFNRIPDFVNKFMQIKGDYILQIIGSGDAEKYIKKMALKDPRIIVLGQMKHDKVIKYQKNADLLINPRQCDDFTKYSFPSKTLEYLKSGKPVLMHKLPGIPCEYDDYLNYYSGNDLEQIIEYIFTNYEEILNKAIQGRKFVLENKNNEYQMRKICNFLESEM